MKVLKWLKDNINFVSLVIGVGFIIGGQQEVGQVIIDKGAQL